MKTLFQISLLFLFFSINISAAEFKTYSEYIRNKELLIADISRIEKIEALKKDSFYTETKEQLQILLTNFDLINAHIGLKTLSSDAKTNGWLEIDEKVGEALLVCDGDNKDHKLCLNEINELIVFVSKSTLKSESKEIIKNLLENYFSEENSLASFDSVFISSLNQNIEKVNLAQAPPQLPKPKVVVPPPMPQEPASEDYDLTYFGGAILILLVGLMYYFDRKKKLKLKTVKMFYKSLFEAARACKREIKIFGTLSFEGHRVFKEIEKPFLDTIILTQVYSPLAHIIFKPQKKILEVEILFHSQHSLLEFMEKESNLLEAKIEELQKAVTSFDGDIFYNKNLNDQGEIINSNIVISLPI